jgi:hypothetical protein
MSLITIVITLIVVGTLFWLVSTCIDHAIRIEITKRQRILQHTNYRPGYGNLIRTAPVKIPEPSSNSIRITGGRTVALLKAGTAGVGLGATKNAWHAIG